MNVGDFNIQYTVDISTKNEFRWELLKSFADKWPLSNGNACRAWYIIGIVYCTPHTEVCISFIYANNTTACHQRINETSETINFIYI